MTGPVERLATRQFQRVVLAVDAAARDRAAVQRASRLAAQLAAELEAVILEDIDVMNMAALPFTKVTGCGPISRAIDEQMIARAWRRAIADLERSLVAVASASAVPASTRVVRGRLGRDVVAHAGDADLIVVDRAALGRDAPRLVGQAPSALLCLARGGIQRRRIFTLFTDTPESDRLLDVAVRFARAVDGAVTVLVSGGEDLLTAARRAATTHTERTGVEIELRAIADDWAAVADALHAAPGGVLAVCKQWLRDTDHAAAVAEILNQDQSSLLVTG